MWYISVERQWYLCLATDIKAFQQWEKKTDSVYSVTPCIFWSSWHFLILFPSWLVLVCFPHLYTIWIQSSKEANIGTKLACITRQEKLMWKKKDFRFSLSFKKTAVFRQGWQTNMEQLANICSLKIWNYFEEK